MLSLLKARGASIKGVEDPTMAGENPKLPAELMDMVKNYFEQSGCLELMNEEEAKTHRKKLMEERSAFKDNAESAFQKTEYSFCEH